MTKHVSKLGKYAAVFIQGPPWPSEQSKLALTDKDYMHAKTIFR